MIAHKYKTISEAETAYREYLDYHIAAVRWVQDNFGTLICTEICVHRNSEHDGDALWLNRLLSQMVAVHDESKYTDAEFNAYRRHFYPSEEDSISDPIRYKDFDYAWRHHYMTNAHHPEHWSSLNYRQPPGTRIPDYFFAEMICDWIAVSLTKHSSLYDWWFNPDTRSDKVQFIDSDDMNFLDEFITEYNVTFDFSDR